MTTYTGDPLPQPDGEGWTICEECGGQGWTERDVYVRGSNADGVMAVPSECLDCDTLGWTREPELETR